MIITQLKTSTYSRSAVTEARDTRPIDACHDDFGECKGIAKGPVFLVGSGMSARSFPFREFSCIPMITMNGAISMFMHTPVKPFFYVCSDRDFSRQQPDLFAAALRSSEHIALWGDQLDGLKSKTKGQLHELKKAYRSSAAILFNRHPDLIRKRSVLSKRSRDIGFSKDMTLGFFDARTVMYVALQIAYHVGFNKVFLVGFDLSQAAGRFYETQTSTCSPCGLDQHYESRILPSLKLMSTSVINDDFEVYNLSATSRVPDDILPKITLDEVRLKLGLSCFHP
ncbi:LPS biosynthesis protein [Pseudomonas syringae]|uniref:Lipopolysaccharide biosynthesis protein n=1 Tax=Pseudomonas syringae CC1417 TaxID=1357272 RepID=A0AAU8LGE2_PSESX